MRNFKVYVYLDAFVNRSYSKSSPFTPIFIPHPDAFHPRLGNYFNEHMFKLALLGSSIIMPHSEEAHLFFLSFSINLLARSNSGNLLNTLGNLREIVGNCGNLYGNSNLNDGFISIFRDVACHLQGGATLPHMGRVGDFFSPQSAPVRYMKCRGGPPSIHPPPPVLPIPPFLN